MDEATGAIRALTWNIHGCVGADGRHDVERVGRIVCRLALDIAAFQEVDARRKSASQPDIQGYLRALVGDHVHEAWALSGADGEYGQMLASRFPLTDRHVHDVSVVRREPRKILEARAQLPSGSLRVIATHLGLRRAERRHQFARLREIVLADPSAPLLLLGDFNEWRYGGTQRRLAGLFDDRTEQRSFPSRLPLFALDRIMCRGGARLLDSRAVREARGASDHLPVMASVALD